MNSRDFRETFFELLKNAKFTLSSVATDDFARFMKEGAAAWKLIDDALERLNEDNQKNIDIGYQVIYNYNKS